MVDPNSPGLDQIREFPDRGNLWPLEDPVLLGELVGIVAPELAERLDFSQAQRINRSFIPADLQKKESDLIVRVSFRDSTPGTQQVRVYVLLEHQSRRDVWIPLRLLGAMVELWRMQVREWEGSRTPASERRLAPVIPLVFYTGRRRWRGPLRLADRMAAPAEVRPFIPDWEMLLLDLRGAAPEVLARASAALGGALRAQRAEAAPWEELESILKAALAELDVLGEEHPGQWLRAVWFLVLLLFHRREPEEYTAFKEHVEARARRLRLRLQEEVEEMGKTMAEVVAERARAEGRAEGRAGGLRHALEAILTERFGPVNPAIAAALDGADLDTLDDWLRSAVRADRLEEIGLPAH